MSIFPLALAGTITLFARIRADGELMLETLGCEPPAGQMVMNCNGPLGTAVRETE